MKTIHLDPKLKEKLPDFQMAVMTFEASPQKNDQLDALIHSIEQEIHAKYELKDVLTIPNIAVARQGYKTLGKDPSRYRLAVESLYRRIVKGNPLYRINDLVDIGNILSLKAVRSTAVLDYDQIEGDDIIIRIGQDEPYEGIGRGTINVEKIPVYCDAKGPFGSTTSDTERTMITNKTKKVLLFIISFNGYTNLKEDVEYAIELYQSYSNAKNFSYQLV